MAVTNSHKPLNIKRFAFASAVLATFAMISPGIQGQETAAQPASLSSESSNPLNDSKIAYQENNFTRVIELTDVILAANPNHAEALHMRASARVEKGIQSGDAALIREGIADARTSITKLETPNAEFYFPYLYGMTHLTMMEQRPEHAKTSVTVATQLLQRLQLSPSHRANILFQRGLAKLEVEDTIDGGVADFNSALQSDPKNIASLTALADTYTMAGKDQEALDAMSKLIDAVPDQPLGFNNRGMYYQQKKEYEAAIADFSQAITVDPDYYVAYINRGYIKMTIGQAAEAEQDFTTAINLQPQNPSIRGLRANSRLRQGKAEDAIADYNKALELFPQNPMLHADLGFAHFFIGEYTEAYQQFDQAINMNNKMRFLDPWIYGSMVLSGQVEEAGNRFAGTVAKPEAERDWIDLLTLYLMGKISDESLANSVNQEDEAASIAQTCEAEYFIGLRTLNLSGPDDARAHFNKSIESGQKHLSAYRGSQFQLKNFD